jgi:hypothetical protein
MRRPATKYTALLTKATSVAMSNAEIAFHRAPCTAMSIQWSKLGAFQLGLPHGNIALQGGPIHEQVYISLRLKVSSSAPRLPKKRI